jgi:peroxiredoxin/outer membrane lipoprotein-sorting protein
MEPAELSAKVAERLRPVQSYSMRVVLNDKQTFSVKAMRPNLYRVESEQQLFLSDGRTSTMFMKERNEYMKSPAPVGGTRVPLADGFALFSPSPKSMPHYTGVVSTTLLGKEVYGLVDEPQDLPGLSTTSYFDKQTLTPLGALQKTSKTTTTFRYEDLNLNASLGTADFSWTPPAGAVDLATKKPRPSPFLKVGEAAPLGSLKTPDGRPMSLEEALRGKKALLVNFWFVNCGYCMAEMPHLQRLYDRLRAKGLEIVAVNDIDSAADVAEYLKKPKFSFPFAVDPDSKIAKAYRAAGSGYPVTFLVDGSGKIAYVKQGFDPNKGLGDIEEALKKLGLE